MQLYKDLINLILVYVKDDRDFLRFYIAIYKIANEKNKERARKINFMKNMIQTKINHYKDMKEKIGNCKYFDHVPKLHPKFLHKTPDKTTMEKICFSDKYEDYLCYPKAIVFEKEKSNIFHMGNRASVLLRINFDKKTDLVIYIGTLQIEIKNTDEIKFGYGLKNLLPIASIKLRTLEKVLLKAEYFLLDSKTILDMIDDEYMCTIQDKIKIKYNQNTNYMFVQN